MNRVDFYILPENSNPNRFVCSLVSKAWQGGNRIYIHTINREDAVMLDDLLWTYNDISFVPHSFVEQTKEEQTSISIGWTGKLPDDQQVMVNLSENIPDFARKFERIVEIVAGDEEQRGKARQRYRDYRDQGYELHDHKIEGDYERA